MNDQDRDLILALVAGDLEGADAEVALARIEADPELMAAFSAQRTAIDALSTVPRAALTASERTSLRESLVGELNLTAERAVAPAPAPRRRVSWWQPMVGVAAAAVFVTAVIVVPEMISGGADDGTAALEELPETTVAVVSDGAGFEEDMGTAGSGDAGGAEDQAETTAEVMTFSPEVDGADLLEATEGETGTESIDEALDDVEPRALPQRSTIDLTVVDACIERLSDDLPDGHLTVLGVEPIDGGLRVFLAVDPGTGVDAVVSIDLPACTLADVHE